MTINRVCQRCGIAERDTEIGCLAYSGGRLVCSECDADLESEWVAEDPRERRHSLDTFSPR